MAWHMCSFWPLYSVTVRGKNHEPQPNGVERGLQQIWFLTSSQPGRLLLERKQRVKEEGFIFYKLQKANNVI